MGGYDGKGAGLEVRPCGVLQSGCLPVGMKAAEGGGRKEVGWWLYGADGPCTTCQQHIDVAQNTAGSAGWHPPP